MASAPQPALLWRFNGTLQESVTGYLPVDPTGGKKDPAGLGGTFTSGKYGQGLQFIPGSFYGFGLWNTVDTNKPLARTYFPYAGGMTVSFWYLPTSLATNGLLFTTSAFTSLTSYTQLDLIYISLDTSGSIGLNTQATTGAFAVAMGTVAVNNWVHVTFGVDTTNIYMYINGVRTLTRSQPSTWATTDITSSGYWMGGMSVGTQHFATTNGSITGIMNDLRVYSSLLSAAQIYGIYQSQGIPPRLTATSNVAQPSLLWSFNGSNVDSVTGLSPTFSTVNTSTQFAPTYVTGLYGQSIYLNNQTYVSSAPNCYVQYDRSPLTSLTTNNLSISFWVNLVSLSLPAPSAFSYRTMISFNETGSSQTTYYTYYIFNNVVNYICQGALQTNTPSYASVYAGQWFHNTIIFSNVGSTSSNTYTTLFINGISIGSTNVGRYNTTSNLSILQLGQAAGGGNPMWGSIQDLRIYNTALTAAQIYGIYQSGGIPPSLSLTKGPTYPLAQTSIVSSALGLYSTRALVSTYTGPVVQVRRNSDSTTYDFIADIYGNLSNVQNSTSMGGFLNTTTGNVSTWYDQSGAGKHFTQATAVSQPQLVLNSGQWVLWFNRDATPTFYASMTTASPITGVMTILYNYNMSTAFNDYTTLLGSNGLDNKGFRFTYLNVCGDAPSGGRVQQDFLASNSSYFYLNNSYGQMVNETTGTIIGNQGSFIASVWNQVIGTQGRQSFSSPYFNSINAPTSGLAFRAAYGYLSEMMLFSAPINSADAQTLWARTPLTNPLPTKTTSG